MIPFNKPFISGKENKNIQKATDLGQLSGDGFFTSKCKEWLEKNTGSKLALLTNSCTAALEMTAILADIKEGDEILMPSFTFVSTANAFVLRGGIPIFIDINPNTLNLDTNQIENFITNKTKAIVPVHYAGFGCDMESILAIAKKYELLVIEDAAQGVMSFFNKKALGSIGDLGCYSFHETKNIISGEGGALLINNERFVQRAEYIREKGTNRSAFYKGEINKYTWVDIGSSFLPGELTAAFLLAQLESATEITFQRLKTWNYYYEGLKSLDQEGIVSIPKKQNHLQHNGHIFYLIHNSENERNLFIKKMQNKGIKVVFHYIPLHNSPFVINNFSTCNRSLPFTEKISRTISRLPMWIGVDKEYILKSTVDTLLEIKKEIL